MQVVCTTKEFSSWRHHDLGTAYRANTKWGQHLISRVLQVLKFSNFIKIYLQVNQFQLFSLFSLVSHFCLKTLQPCKFYLKKRYQTMAVLLAILWHGTIPKKQQSEKTFCFFSVGVAVLEVKFVCINFFFKLYSFFYFFSPQFE